MANAHRQQNIGSVHDNYERTRVRRQPETPPPGTAYLYSTALKQGLKIIRFAGGHSDDTPSALVPQIQKLPIHQGQETQQ